MVLSNKKLKQKIREELGKLLVSSETKSNQEAISNDSKTQTQTHPQSFKSLLDSVTQKPRLSKREIKRLKTDPFQENGSNGVSKEIGENGGSKGVEEGQKREKKRKRESKDEGGEEKEGKKMEQQKKSNKKKKNKHKKKKKMEKSENVEEEEKKVVELLQSGIDEQVVAKPTEANVSNEKEDLSTKVYVGGIPYYSTEDDIRSYFEGCGTITEIDCLYFPETGKFKGIAMISFKTEAAAKRALALDGSDMGGLFLKIQPYKASKDTKGSDFAPAIMEGYNRIYIGNLSWDITEDELKKLFSDCTISSIRLGKDKETGEFRGFAHVDFADSLSLTIALKLDQQIVCGRPVRIRCAVPPKSSQTNSKPMLTIKKDGDLKLFPSSQEAETFTPVPSIKKAEDRKYVTPTNMDAEVNVGSDVSGKIKRRTCYECGQKGHLSSACPTSNKSEPLKTEDMKYDAPTNVDAEENLASDISGKIKRRTCYECGQKGHLSSACPTSNKSAPSKPEGTRSLVPTNMDLEEDVASDISGKIKRRTCYECGQKGHLSSACPTRKNTESSKPVFSSYKAEETVTLPTYKRPDDIKSLPSTNKDVEDNLVNSTLSGKIRRRTCYECGEKGHLSSACPKKLASDATITSDSIPVSRSISEGHISPKKVASYSTITSGSMTPLASSKNGVDAKSVGPTNVNGEESGGTAVSGKIRRRTCYECGEKGHLSSACPKKLAAE